MFSEIWGNSYPGPSGNPSHSDLSPLGGDLTPLNRMTVAQLYRMALMNRMDKINQRAPASRLG